MLQPKKSKHRKWQKGRSFKRALETRGVELAFGNFGLKSLATIRLTDKQIEAAMKEIKRVLGKKGRAWLRVFPHLSVTKKPPEVGMGGGKGDIAFYATVVHSGKVIIEVDARDQQLAIKSLKAGAYKLPIKTKIVGR
jgi:large subunit ribosomal protein L16